MQRALPATRAAQAPLDSRVEPAAQKRRGDVARSRARMGGGLSAPLEI